jgi:hypothetical protein
MPNMPPAANRGNVVRSLNHNKETRKQRVSNDISTLLPPNTEVVELKMLGEGCG